MSAEAKQPRRWTKAEMELARRSFAAGMTCRQMMPLLPGRSATSIYQLKFRLGLVVKQRRIGGQLDPLIRLMRRQGRTDPEIAAAWNQAHPGMKVSRKWVCDRRLAMGVPSVGWTEGRRERVAQKTREQLQKVGFTKLWQLRDAVFRRRAVESGWPEELRIREVQILNLIWDKGPLTKLEICRHLGMPHPSSKKALKNNDPGGNYLATLMRRGLLVSMPRAVKTGRRGGNVHLYLLPLNVQRRNTQRKERDVENIEPTERNRTVTTHDPDPSCRGSGRLHGTAAVA